MSIGKEARSSFFWSAGIQGLSQVLSLVVSIILARILSPQEFGIIGMVTIFIVISKVFIDGGFSVSLIRSPKVLDIDYSTVFITNFGVSLFLYLLLYIVAPLVSRFFEEVILTNILRVYGLVLIIQSLSFIQSVKLNKELKFKSQFLILLPSMVISGGISIALALNGYGVWSLVLKEIIYISITTILLWYFSSWKFQLQFNMEVFRRHFSFGYKILLTDLLTKVMKSANNLVIGKYYSSADLGFFSRAKTMADIPNAFIFNTINRIMLPVLSKLSNDEEKMINAYRRIIKTAFFFIVPVQALFILEAKPVFIILLTEKWLPAIEYFNLFVLYGLLLLIPNYMFSIFKLKGRSDLILIVSSIDFVLIGITLAMGVFYGIKLMLLGLVFSGLLKSLITMFLVAKITSYSLVKQIKDISFSGVTSLIIYVLFYYGLHFFPFSNWNNYLELMVVSSVYFSTYFLVSFVIKHSVTIQLIGVVKNRILK